MPPRVASEAFHRTTELAPFRYYVDLLPTTAVGTTIFAFLATFDGPSLLSVR